MNADPNLTPDEYVVVPKDTLRAIVDRLNTAMRRLPLGAAADGLDGAYLELCVAWSHARHALGEHGATPDATPDIARLRAVSGPTRPCPGCVDRCGQCAAG